MLYRNQHLSKAERNKAIFNDHHLAQYSNRELAEKYKLSETRILFIVARQKEIQELEQKEN